MSTLARIQMCRAAIIPVAALSTLFVLSSAPIYAQRGGNQSPPPDTLNDPVRLMVARLDLEKYKATIKGLTQFGDRRQGTERNRNAVDWIEAQLKSYGCTPTERIKYMYTTPPRRDAAAQRRSAAREVAAARGGSAGGAVAVAETPRRAADALAASGRGPASTPIRSSSPTQAARARTPQPATDGDRARKCSARRSARRIPEEMYIVGGHMDGHGWGEAANDDGSGTALVMELARVFSSPDVKTDRTIRFVLWNNEETGTNGARAYIAQRAGAAGQGEPAGLGQVSRAEVARHDPARHDDVRSRHAAPRRHDESGAATRGRRQHRVRR